jgi:uncharacterized membrane protein
MTDPPHPLERAITLSDAVVAIAMTLLVLPLVDLATQPDATDVGALLRVHGNVLNGFVVSFLVIYQFWVAHERAFAQVRTAGRLLRWLNMWWLLAIAFLPYPTAVVGRRATTSTVPLYIGTMFVLSILSAGMAAIGDRERRAASGGGPMPRRTRVVRWLTPAVFAVCAGLGVLNADLGLYALFLLVVVGLLETSAPGPRRAPDQT